MDFVERWDLLQQTIQILEIREIIVRDFRQYLKRQTTLHENPNVTKVQVLNLLYPSFSQPLFSLIQTLHQPLPHRRRQLLVNKSHQNTVVLPPRHSISANRRQQWHHAEVLVSLITPIQPIVHLFSFLCVLRIPMIVTSGILTRGPHGTIQQGTATVNCLLAVAVLR